MKQNPPIICPDTIAMAWPKPREVTEAVRESPARLVFGSGQTSGGRGEHRVTVAEVSPSRLLGTDHMHMECSLFFLSHRNGTMNPTLPKQRSMQLGWAGTQLHGDD
jgi:hypothetical protein